ncbi:MAG: hypothetical protein ABGZ35_26365, partial [Planctomycetaceae bacterium]
MTTEDHNAAEAGTEDAAAPGRTTSIVGDDGGEVVTGTARPHDARPATRDEVEVSAAGVPVVEHSILEQPAVEQPAVEQPAVEQPAVEQPAVEQPAV